MKKILLTLMVATACLTQAGLPTGPMNMTFAWDSQPDTDVFFIYTSTSLTNTLPWTPYTNTLGTNFSIVVQITPGVQFYYLTASNYWGESTPSNTLGFPHLPIAAHLTAKKGP